MLPIKKLILFLSFIVCASSNISAQNQGDYRAIASGNFEDLNIWQRYDAVTKQWEAALSGSPGGFFTIGSSYSITINSSASAGTMVLNGTLTLASGVTFSAVRSNLYGGSVNGPGTISVYSSDTLEMYSGTIASNENITIQPGGLLILDVNPMAINGTVTNYGTTKCSSNEGGSGSFINNGTFISNNAGDFSLSFTNNGVVNYTGANALMNTFNNVNPGVVNISSGSIMLIRSYTSTITESGIYNIASGGELYCTDGSVLGTYNFTGTISGAGMLRLSCTTANISGTYNITGTTRISSGTVNFDPATTVTSIGSLLADGGTLNLPSGLTINGLGNLLTIQFATINFNTGHSFSVDSLTVYSGDFAGSDTVTVTNIFTSKGGSLNGTAAVILGPACVLNMSQNPLVINSSLINNGTINWANANFGGAGTLINNGTINVSTSVFCTSNFNNSGLGKLNITGNTYFLGGVSNFGIINLNSGTLTIAPLNSSYTIGGTINAASGTTLYLGGNLTINSSIISAGTVSLSGTLNFHNTYNNTGTTTITGGTINFNGDMTITNIGNINANGGTTNFLNGLTINGIGSSVNISGTVDFSSGHTVALQNLTLTNYLSGSDSITISGNFVSDGYLHGPGARTILTGGTGTLWDNGFIYSGTILYNYGTLTWQEKDIKGNGAIDNRNIFNITSNTTSSSYVTILNNGIINRTTNSTPVYFSNPMVNNGTFNINTGTVYVSSNSTNPGAINITSGSTLALYSSNYTPTGIINISSGAFLSGGYQLNFNGTQLNNDGTISVSTLQFGASTTLSGAGTISSNVIVTNTGHLTLGSDHQLSTLTINTSGIADISTHTLYMNGNGLPLVNNGTFTTTSGTVEYNGTSAQTGASTNISYYNLTINNFSGVSLSSSVNVNGILNLLRGTFTNSSYLTMGNGSTISRTSGTLSAAPNFGTTINLIYSGIGSAITTGLEVPASSSVLNNLALNNSTGLILNSNITANGIVTLQNGNIITGASNILDLNSTASLAGETNGRYVIGKLIITENVGTANSNFGGIGVRLFPGADNIGNVTVTRISGSAGNITAGSISSINRKWIITSDNPPTSGRTLILYWTSDDDNGKNLTNVQAWQSSDAESTWNTIGTMQDASSTRGISFYTTSFSEFTVSDPSININLKVFLQGPYNGAGAMTTTLNSSGLLPLTSETAYASSTFGYTASTVASIPNSNIVDWILVELRTGTAASTKVVSRAGFLKNDGTIVDVDGTSPLNFSGIFSGSYYIVIRHRNHLAIMSASAIALSSSSNLYNFSSSQSQAYGTNPMKDLGGGIFGLFAGDSNKDGQITALDFNTWNVNTKSGQVGYVSDDMNLDGQVTVLDFNPWNANTKLGATTNVPQ